MPIRDLLTRIRKKAWTTAKQCFFPVLAAAVAAYVLRKARIGLDVKPEDFLNKYRTGFRVPLFTGFLTIGSFMLSFKAFTVLRLYDDVYKTKEYKDRWLARAEQFHLTPDSFLDPLARLTDTFYLAILASLLTSLSQLTIGLINKVGAVYFCAASAVFSGMFVFRALRILRKNLIEWQRQLAKKYEKELEAELASRKLAKKAKDSERLAAGNEIQDGRDEG